MMEDYLFSLAKKKLDLDDETIDTAKKILSEWDRGKSDIRGAIGSAIYLAGKITGDKRTEMQISKALGVSEMTIRANIYRRNMARIAYRMLSEKAHSHKLPQSQ